jgi:AcrR family transcriptional regulator
VPPRATVEKAVRPGRGRRPASEVRQAVLEAAARLLYDEGLRAVTFERVAAAAGASKVTLYKWWSTPAVLAFEAYHADVMPGLAFPDTGDFQTDLRTQLHSFARAMMERPGSGARTRGQVIAEIVGAAHGDATLADAFHEYYTTPRRELTQRMFRLARERGQIPAHLDLPARADQLWGACYHKLMMFGEPLDGGYIDALIANLFGRTD